MLLMKLQRVEDDLEVLKSASSQAELIEGMEKFGDSAHELMTQVNTYTKPNLVPPKKIWFPANLGLVLTQLPKWDDWRAY